MTDRPESADAQAAEKRQLRHIANRVGHLSEVQVREGARTLVQLRGWRATLAFLAEVADEVSRARLDGLGSGRAADPGRDVMR